jgi:hypothetical protein
MPSSAYAGEHGLAVEECLTLAASSRRQTCCASADFANRRMTHRSLGVGGYVCWGPRAYPWGSIDRDKTGMESLESIMSCLIQDEKLLTFDRSVFKGGGGPSAKVKGNKVIAVSLPPQQKDPSRFKRERMNAPTFGGPVPTSGGRYRPLGCWSGATGFARGAPRGR